MPMLVGVSETSLACRSDEGKYEVHVCATRSTGVQVRCEADDVDEAGEMLRALEDNDASPRNNIMLHVLPFCWTES